MTLKDYKLLFNNFNDYNTYTKEKLRKTMKDFGEIDAFININFKHGANIITLCSLNLIHNSFSQRGNLVANKDLYKGNGRVRHESYIIQQGPFQCIHIDSLQAKEVNKDSKINYDVGGEYNFDIHIFRNNQFREKWKNYEHLSIKQLQNTVMANESRGHQEDARREATMEFLNFVDTKIKSDLISDFKRHRNSVRLMSAIYKSAALKKYKKNPLVEVKYD